MIAARILIVEDDRVVARDIRQQLVQMGHEVVGTSTTCDGAVLLAANHEPDLVLMDIRLEGAHDGIEAARRIRDQHQIPVVFLTAYANDDVIRRASLTDPFGYLIKPFDERQVRTVIQMALYKHASDLKVQMGERRYAATLDSIEDGVITCDSEQRVDFMNPAAERLTGWKLGEGRGRQVGEVVAFVDEESGSTLPRHEAAAGSGTLLRSLGGTSVPVEERRSSILDTRGNVVGTVMVLNDLTEKRRAAEALRSARSDLAHVERMALMGELAAMLAHEVNQPLMAIVTNAGSCVQWLAREQPEIGKARAAVDRVVRDAVRAGEVVRSIRALSRRSREGSSFDFNDLVAETVSLMSEELRRSSVRLDVQSDKPRFIIFADRVQIQQVLLNLVMNAVESMSDISDRPRLVRVRTSAGESAVTLQVADSGRGISPEIRDRVFDALFTTKTSGMGMGLSISRSIVEMHQGTIEVSSTDDAGTVISVRLPLASDLP
jgi:PAS domain S-box-containing protein